MKKIFSFLLSMAAMTAFAQMTPVGVWHTIDDETNQPKGEIKIYEKDGALVGVVGRALKEDPNPSPIAINVWMIARDNPSLAWKFCAA